VVIGYIQQDKDGVYICYLYVYYFDPLGAISKDHVHFPVKSDMTICEAVDAYIGLLTKGV
jgi:hypothetical protein